MMTWGGTETKTIHGLGISRAITQCLDLFCHLFRCTDDYRSLRPGMTKQQPHTAGSTFTGWPTSQLDELDSLDRAANKQKRNLPPKTAQRLKLNDLFLSLRAASSTEHQRCLPSNRSANLIITSAHRLLFWLGGRPQTPQNKVWCKAPS